MTELIFKSYDPKNLSQMTDIWNEVLLAGDAFPGEELYYEIDFHEFLLEQTATTCLFIDDKLAGYYILHPNNIGRCSHIANASYCIVPEFRGQKLADPLVKYSLKEARELGFAGIQFNAVVVSNQAALKTYTKNDFKLIGTIPAGFLLKDGTYSDIQILYHQFK
ncbi:GNAT family N-acetyltransferase [Enterococcus sp. ALS3]|uniref:GNAT family N-acetyltransferase n=1 Tax=Enterococcus alishanensis TaxID=1303817 RepID=A0ABS6TGH6_9ENTE|nr:GNAT family N-acetyltransferase [Enterococcus alishanensis]MBV7391914.1 GNAT family N-acetyltransferase [Enterococcus alishanensis]